MSNRHITVDQFGDGLRKAKAQIDSAIAAHNASETAHPIIQDKIGGLKDRVLALEIASGGEVTANPFAVTFGSLEGTISDGIWDVTNMRLGF